VHTLGSIQTHHHAMCLKLTFIHTSFFYVSGGPDLKPYFMKRRNPR
jgi:hypothetical protein